MGMAPSSRFNTQKALSGRQLLSVEAEAEDAMGEARRRIGERAERKGKREVRQERRGHRYLKAATREREGAKKRNGTGRTGGDGRTKSAGRACGSSLLGTDGRD